MFAVQQLAGIIITRTISTPAVEAEGIIGEEGKKKQHAKAKAAAERAAEEKVPQEKLPETEAAEGNVSTATGAKVKGGPQRKAKAA